MPDCTHHLRLTPALPEYADAVLAFESENRAHFETWIASRGDDFYCLPEVARSLIQAQINALALKECHYLAWCDNEIVGRVTLRHIERQYFHKASLGYRFSQRHGGRGLATWAVNAVLNIAVTELHLHRIEAVVAEQNQASRAIMHKCRFTQFGHSHASALLHEQWVDLLHYERRLPLIATGSTKDGK